MIISFFHFYSLVILLVSLFFSCFRYFYIFISFIGDIFKIIVKRYWIALEIALYKFIIIIIIIISDLRLLLFRWSSFEWISECMSINLFFAGVTIVTDLIM